MITGKMLWDAVWLAYGVGLPVLVFLVVAYAAITTPLPDRGKRGRKNKA